MSTKKKMPAKKAPAKKPAAKPMKKPAAKAAPVAVPKPTKIGPTPQVLRGFKDVVPQEQRYFRYVTASAESLARAYGYDRIDTPILEDTALFTRTVGKQTDVVEKEMFTFLDKSNDSVTLRPEGTAPIARAYINHGMLNLPQPVKMFYLGPMFRYERPQSGRYRQHHQFGVEVFGDQNPILDAEIILLATLFFRGIGLKTTVSINSLGCSDCRLGYLGELTTYYRSKRSQLCEDCKRRLAKNPLRLLDCKEPTCEPVKESAPNLIDYLDEGCKGHLMSVLEYLDDLEVGYVLNPHLVRGFDYYNRTVFEILPEEGGEGSTSALGGGGRYDSLVEQLGGRPTPACGFGVGIERAVLALKAKEIEPPNIDQPHVFLAQLGDVARRKAFTLFEDLRNAGVRVAGNFTKNSLKSQLELSNKLGARYTVILGQQEVLDGTILVRDMESGMQEIVDYKKGVSELQKKIQRM